LLRKDIQKIKKNSIQEEINTLVVKLSTLNDEKVIAATKTQIKKLKKTLSK
jgi:Cu/Ag efflux pump CusA